jgi:hypothetical protein
MDFELVPRAANTSDNSKACSLIGANMNNRMILWCVLVLTHRVLRMTFENGLLVPRAANISDLGCSQSL